MWLLTTLTSDLATETITPRGDRKEKEWGIIIQPICEAQRQLVRVCVCVFVYDNLPFGGGASTDVGSPLAEGEGRDGCIDWLVLW